MITSNLGNNYSSKSVKAKVELYDGYTLVATCTCSETGELFPGSNSLSHFTMSRDGELGKFFGFGICHKLEMTLIDLEKVLRLYEGYTAKVCLGDGTTWDCPYPKLDVTSVKVDKKSGDITVTAYDHLNKASELTYNDLGITLPYTLKSLAQACGAALGLEVVGVGGTEFNLSYAKGGNYNGDESVRSVLNHIAEVTQTVYFINHEDKLEFKRLSATKVADYYRADYYEFEVESAKRLTGICHATELGENLEVTTADLWGDTEKGVTQFIRDNPLWELREDLPTLLNQALSRVGGNEIQQYELDWSGDYRLEIGDYIAIHFDDDITYVFILNDTLTYGGTMDEESAWEWVDNEGETFANPINLGEKLNQTFARVNKIEKDITLYVGDVVEEALSGKVDDLIDESLEGIVTDVNNLKAQQQTTTQSVTQLQLTTDGITADVGTLKTSNTILTNQVDAVVAEQTSIKNNISSLEQKDNEIVASVQQLESTRTTKTYVDEQIAQVKTDSNGYTDQKITETTTLINNKVAEIKVTTDGITQRVESEEKKTVEIESDIDDLNTTTTELETSIGQLQVTDSSITASIESLRENTKTSLNGVNDELNSVNKKLESTMTVDQVELKISETLANGVDSVTTTTGFTFNDEGLHISKSTSEMESLLDETGLTVSRRGTTMLQATSDGVDARNLTAQEYLRIENIRFEKYGRNRMGCFWIGD